MYPSLIPSLPLGSFLGKRPGKRKENDIFLPQGIWWGRWAYTQGEVLGNGKVEGGARCRYSPGERGTQLEGDVREGFLGEVMQQQYSVLGRRKRCSGPRDRE